MNIAVLVAFVNEPREVVLITDRLHRVAHALLAIRRIDELYFCPCQIRSRGHDIQVLKLNSPQAGTADVSRPDQDLVRCLLE